MSQSSQKEKVLLSKALKAYSNGQFTSIPKAAAHFGVSKHKLYGRKTGKLGLSARPATNSTLTNLQQRALITWIELLNSVNIAPIAKDIEWAANHLLIQAGSDVRVGKMYGYRFIKRLPQHISLIRQKPMEKARIEAELLGRLTHWYRWIEISFTTFSHRTFLEP